MAGIGFELNKILVRQGYIALFRAYAYAGLIGSGAWLIAVITLGLLGTVLASLDMSQDRRIFFVSISVIYGFTLILTGPIQMVLTRHVADREFAGDRDSIFPTYLSCLAWVAFFFAVFGMVVFVGFVPGPALFRWSAALLTTLVAGIWISSLFLSALKNYHAVLLGFAAGCGISFATSWRLAIHWGLGGAMLGFAFGHAVLVLILAGVIYRELGNSGTSAADLLPCFRKYWDLALAGFFYNLGVWIDKFLYWWVDPNAEVVAGPLRTSPVFDRVVYFSFLTILPGMAVFLLKLETEFAEKNQLFCQHVLKKGTMAQIHELKTEMVRALREGMLLLVKVQGFCTGILILAAGQILVRLRLDAVQSGVLQISLVGLFLLVIFMALQTILFYLDKRFDAMVCCAVFTVVNGSLTVVGILVGERWRGVGFLAATAVAVVMAGLMVNRHLRNLEYDTFTGQPLYSEDD